jgi:hypothetical protein
VQQLLGEHAEAITRKVMIQALQGDGHAQRLCLERLSAPQRDARVRIPLGPTKTAAEVDVASQRALRAIANGTITPTEGGILTNILELRRRAIESAEIEARLEKLEREAAAKGRKAA